ncbi:MAG: hypothetical protein U9Q30_00940 [Campylobacterota bacterium]|nr:hypothetical protein [Campylobacterota bacterium]
MNNQEQLQKIAKLEKELLELKKDLKKSINFSTIKLEDLEKEFNLVEKFD